MREKIEIDFFQSSISNIIIMDRHNNKIGIHIGLQNKNIFTQYDEVFF